MICKLSLNKSVKKLLKEDLCSAYKQPNIQKVYYLLYMTYTIFFTYNLHYTDIFYIEYKYKDDIKTYRSKSIFKKKGKQ